MLVFRCFDALGCPSVKVEIHGKCCGTGTCAQPDQTEYQHAQGVTDGAVSPAVGLADAIHAWIIDTPEEMVEDLLRSHLMERRTR